MTVEVIEVVEHIDVIGDVIEVIETELVETVDAGIPGPSGIAGAQGGQGVQGQQGIQGAQGPQGPAGGTSTYRHVQGVPSSSWTVVHGLGFYPNVAVVDSSARVVEGEVEYLDANTVRITFSSAMAGEAYFS